MAELHRYMQQLLEEREVQNALRELPVLGDVADFCSNDYLGLARSAALHQHTLQLLEQEGDLRNGSTGSRLISGNSSLSLKAETDVAAFARSESALIFNSGYDANLGLISSMASRHDTILYDEWIHASIRDGVRLSLATTHSFRHNDMDDLRMKLQQAKGDIFICTESVFSMDGDLAPLPDMVQLAREYGARIVADEAHATGIFGDAGEGLAAAPEYQDVMLARVITFGKALGVHGAAVVGSERLRSFLVNFARSFIYTTALPPHSYAAIRAAVTLAGTSHTERKQLQENRILFSASGITTSYSPIYSVEIPGNAAVKQTARKLRENGLAVLPILSPTVPKGRERLRICMHSYNTAEEIQQLIQSLSHA